MKLESQVFMGSGVHSLAAVGHLHMLIDEAVRLLGGIQQNPACTEEPCLEEDERREDDARRVEQIAKEIYLGLTGKKVKRIMEE